MINHYYRDHIKASNVEWVWLNLLAILTILLKLVYDELFSLIVATIAIIFAFG